MALQLVVGLIGTQVKDRSDEGEESKGDTSSTRLAHGIRRPF